ncbi:MAG: hypothetical protein M3209_00865 [Acidobacteriota bacterium]|nr:hypothetical protein [Acidobacteriota bacterium]
MNEERKENSDNPTGNVSQESIVEESGNDSDIPLFLRGNPDIAQGDAQDERDEAPE